MANSRIKCTSCKKYISRNKCMKCAVCDNFYDLVCSGFTDEKYAELSYDYKTTWACKVCCGIRPKSKTDNSESVTPTSRPIQPQNTCNSSTLRTQYRVSTENSFELLSEDDDISCSLSNNGNTLNRSCPEIGTNKQEQLDELRQKIVQLEKKLASAENEIDNMIEENFTLKGQISENEQKINKLLRICKSTSKLTNEKKSNGGKVRRSINRTKLDFTQLEDTPTTQSTQVHTNDLEIVVVEKTSLDTNDPNPASHAADSPKDTKTNNNTTDQKQNETLNKIYILGDEQLRGLASTMLHSRHGKWNDVYKPFAFIMTGATSTDILLECDNIAQKLTDKDSVIISVGSHDKDILRLHSNLCIIINKLNIASVFVTPVNYNPYLNEKMLNDSIKLWTRHFDRCNIIESKKKIANHSDYLNHICNKVNLCIDYAEYEKQFLTFTNILGFINSNRQSPSDTRTKSLPKIGTIPYYFKLMNGKKHNKKIREEPETTQDSMSSPKTFFRP